jgi:hypothetical protein
MIVNYRSLASNPGVVMSRIADFVELEDRVELSLEGYNKRFGEHIHSGNPFSNKQICYSAPSMALSMEEEMLHADFNQKECEPLRFIAENSI